MESIVFTDADYSNIRCDEKGVDRDWSDELLKTIRARIKSHYIEQQGSVCPYCDRHQGTENHRVWDIDHVVPRSTHPAFTFEPRNLVASCPDCNVAKGDASVLVNSKRKTYPAKAEAFNIIHPHFDAYDDHIAHSGHVYVGKTVKGKKTIYQCDLLRFAQKYIDWSTPLADDRFETEVEAIVRGEAGADSLIDGLRDELG
ncbi:HNH endonuclease [Aeromicrobium sp. JJY06]|uniref:HNH endonuclease n=1 Tax=Aeromicrobium sp. JJY06 TaxID=3373478 RepID=UPI00376EC4F6